MLYNELGMSRSIPSVFFRCHMITSYFYFFLFASPYIFCIYSSFFIYLIPPFPDFHPIGRYYKNPKRWEARARERVKGGGGGGEKTCTSMEPVCVTRIWIPTRQEWLLGKKRKKIKGKVENNVFVYHTDGFIQSCYDQKGKKAYFSQT